MPSRTLVSAVLSLSVVACSADSTRPNDGEAASESSIRSARAHRNAAAAGRRSRGFEDEILRMEDRIPGLGGVSADPVTGQIIVYLTDLSHRAEAMNQLRIIAPTLQVPAALRTKLGVEGSTAIRQGQFAFSELVAWTQAAATQRRGGQFLSIDADEGLNRVRITLPEGGNARAALALVTALGVPEAAVLMETRPTGHLYVSLRDRIRPTGSGIQISNGAGECSLGFNVDVQFYGQKGFLTAAHCSTGSLGSGTTGGTIYQNTVGLSNVIGTVQLNPAWNRTDLECGGYTLCTDGDATFVLAASTLAADWAKRIASTTTWGSNNGGGSTTINSWWTGISIIPFTYQGAPVYKVGRTSGVTTGTIAATCEYPVYDSAVVLCEDKVTGASAGPGDSGGAVFYPSDTFGNPPYAIGLLSGGGGSSYSAPEPDGSYHCTAGCFFHFTSFDAAQTHLSRYFTP